MTLNKKSPEKPGRFRSCPDAVIERENADVAMHCARFVSKASQPSPYDTPSALHEWTKQMAGCYSVDYITANNKVVAFLKALSDNSERRIPPDVSFDFVGTVMYLSENSSIPPLRS
jgi:hypothetical protein